MQRREFIERSLAGGGMWAAAASGGSQNEGRAAGDVFIERPAPGRPHAGKVLATIAPHADDHSIFAAGTVAMLIEQGYTGYLVRTSNDEMDSYDLSPGQTVLANETDNRAMAAAMGIKQVFDLNYRNHRMDDISRVELRARLIFLFRLLEVDTVFTYDPWQLYEENPDHYVTAHCVEAACWMAGRPLDFPEHFAAGLKPHAVKERYYYARGPQEVNRVVDISSTVEKKMAAIRANKTMLGHMIGRLRDRLAQRELKLPELEGDEDSAVRAFAELRFRNIFAELGRQYGLAYAERFHYIGPDESLDDYIARHAVPL